MFPLTYRPDPKIIVSPDGSSKPAKDRDFTSELVPSLTATSAGDVDLRRYCTDTNQFNIGACAGNATADSVELLNAIELEKQGKPNLVQLSRLFVYSMARGMMDEDGDGQADIDKDQGTYIRLCFEVLSTYGICDESVWPYDTSKVFTVPSFKAIRQATAHRIHSYYRINEEGEDRLAAVRTALRSKHPVVFGTLVTQDFMTLRGAGPVNLPLGGTAGGHAMLIVGCIGENFLVKNSWGPNWGDHGYWLMTPEYLMWESTWDLWVPVMASLFEMNP